MVESNNQFAVPTQLGLEKKGCSLRHHCAFMGSKSYPPSLAVSRVQMFVLRFAIALLLALALLLAFAFAVMIRSS